MVRASLRRGAILRGAGWLAACLLTACGVGAQNRPFVVSTFPASGQVLDGTLGEIRITYNEPVTILNGFDARVFFGGTVLLTVVTQRAGEPNSVYVSPFGSTFFPVDVDLGLQVERGTVINGGEHYADEVYVLRFTVGPDPAVPVGGPGRVALLDSLTFALLEDVPTPAGRDPTGVASTLIGSTRRIWVQLDNGAGVGAALARFSPGDAAMTPIALTASGGDLLSTTGAIEPGPFGRFLYAAYRSTSTGCVRLFRIDLATGLEAGFLDLTAIPAGPAAMPVDLEIDAAGSLLMISAADGATGRIAFVDRASFSEIDRDAGTPGVQGAVLSAGAGRITTLPGQLVVTHPGTEDSSFLQLANDVLIPAPGGGAGTTVDVLSTTDGVRLFEPLAGFPGDFALQVRSQALGFFNPMLFPVSDDVGGVSAAATDAVAMQRFSSSPRFLLMLGSPAGRLMTTFLYQDPDLFQEDLDAGTAGVQAVNIEASVPGATVIGRVYGALPPP